MNLGISGRTSLVLGASQGLGLAIAQRLASEGADVILCARNAEKLQYESAQINVRGGGQASYVVSDLATTDGLHRITSEISTRCPDILINNSGGPAPSMATAILASDWQREFSTMAAPIFEITRHAVIQMRKKKWGRIATVASSGVVQPIPNLPISNALRASLVAWSKSLATELAAEGITANVIVPGRIATARVSQLDQAAAKKTDRSVDDVMKASLATIPAGRYGRAEEFAAVVAFIVSEPASYVTGSIIRVDGGMIRSI